MACCPADKAAILVAAHNIIVGEYFYPLFEDHLHSTLCVLDGLSRLPPLHLKSDEAGPEVVDSRDKKSGDEAANSPSTIEEDSPSVAAPRATDADTSATFSEASSGATLRLTEPVNSDTDSPLLTVSPPKTPTPVSGDILLPLIIFSVVKANPSQLVSHLLFTQRYRNKSVGGEESYCLINLMAVVEFLENVDLAALGLKDSESKVLRYEWFRYLWSSSSLSLNGTIVLRTSRRSHWRRRR